jgi:7-cyano-7-deazaguanine reductase
MTDLGASPLGHATSYADEYDPRLLFPVDRAPLREELGFGAAWPFHGVDLWNAYELSWLLPAGKPQVAIATFAVPASSPRIVESKSVKLYLTAFNQSRFASAAAVTDTLARDLTAATGAPVGVTLTAPDGFGALPHAEPEGECLDALPVACERHLPDPDALQLAPAVVAGPLVAETLFTRLFRSVCPVTGQPDYASVSIRYRGRAIERAGLLRYLVSFRRHPGFHEHCVERIFADVWRRCQPETLAVGARFTRRGGVDINPWRSSREEPPPANRRTARQ